MENVKKIVYSILMFLGVMVVIGVIIDIADGGDTPIYPRDDIQVETKQDYSEPIKPPARNVDDYIGNEAEQEFYSGCGYDEYCVCVFKYLDTHMTNSEFLSWARTLTEDSIYTDPTAVAAVEGCI